MSRKRTGIILAWDSNTFNAQDEDKLGEILPHIDMVKTGLQSLTALDANGVSIAYKVEKSCGGKAMRDWKVLDIENTVTNALKNILLMGTGFVTLHAQMSDEGLSSAAALCKEASTKPLAVTILTDLDNAQCRSRFLAPNAMYAGNFVAVLVENFARNAYNRGIRGFVCSALEAEIIRAVAPDATIVTPAIRPLYAVKPDEQKRVTTPTKAVEAGADYMVIGRPILSPPQGMSCSESARRIRDEADSATPPGSFVDKTV
jgi:orotidine-5'-phosphate decarboxylase